ncbi:MAG: hypothetical protein HYZ10_13475 [Ignavibacteriales bacterium]|nr:hypothetical protein [Ignavibacteriales bacterium]
MKKILFAFLFLVLIISSCKLKEDTTGTDPTGTTSTAIKVLTPNGNEVLPEGSSYQITWSGTGTTLVKIQYSIDNGTSWSLVVDSLTNTGVYSWFPVPNTISNQCRLQVTSVDGKSTDASDNVFSIIRNSNQSLKIVAPKDKEEWEGGSAKQIKWFSSGIDSVKIEYTTNNGTKWNLVAVDKKNTGIFYWEPVPNTPSTLARVRIMDAKDGEPSSESDVFNILPEPKIKVIAPNGGERILSSTSRKIEWVTENIENVKLAYTTNNGFEWVVIKDAVPSTGFYIWDPVPTANSQLCKIRVYDAKDNEPSDVSDSTFTITNQITQTLEVTGPNGSERWQAGTNQQITWKSSGVAKVKIELTSNNGLTWNTIVDQLANTGAYEWNVPNSISTQCLIKISDADDSDPVDQSNGLFRIVPKPELRITKPNGGETWTAGIIDTIKWSSVGVENITIEYTPNNGINWFTIVENTPSSGSYITSLSAAGTQYKIRITDKENGSPQDESDGTFTVSAEPKIVVLEPNGKEEWYAGSSNNIKWTSTNIENVKIEYTTNNGASWTLITSSTPSDGVYPWDKIPNVSSLQCRVRISDAIDNIPSDVSDDNFSITTQGNQLIKVVKPNGGENWPLGSPQEITWDAAGITNVKIEYTINNGLNWNLITASTPSTGYYTWTQVPNTPATNCKVRISDAQDSAPSDESDLFFTIGTAPSLKVLEPNGNDTWISGTTKQIRWSSENVANVKIEYTIDGGASWNVIVNSMQSTGSYYWNNIPAINSLQCKIKISDAQFGTPSDLSDDNFAIMKPGDQQLKVKTPNGGEKWIAGTPQNITWDAGGIANVKIEFTSNNGISWNTIIASTPSDGFYTWTQVPNTQATNCLIRISDAQDNEPSDVSDNFFSVDVEPSLKMVAPNGGEVWSSGSSKEIRWTSSNVATVKIEFTTNGGASWATIVNSIENTGSYQWSNIPSANSLLCKVKVSDADDGNPFAISENYFQISNQIVQVIRIISPNGGENWREQQSQTIKWDSQGITQVNIDYSTNNGNTWVSIVKNHLSSGSYQWQIPANINSIQCKVRISDAADEDPSDESNSSFSIQLTPEISKINFPSNGASIIAGEQITIQWESKGIRKVKIEYNRNDLNQPSDWFTLVDSLDNSGSFPTTFKYDPLATSYVVRISATDGSASLMSGTFKVLPPPSVSVLSPNGGEQWLATPAGASVSDPQKYHPYEITWRSTNAEKVKIEWSTNGGGSWYLVPGAEDLNSTGSFIWAPGRDDLVRPQNSDNCLIRVSSSSGSSDMSDANFSIHDTKKIRVEYPNSGEDFYVGHADRYVMLISWTSYAISGNVNIYYSLQNGADGTWVQLVSNYKSTGAYVWDYANDPLIGTSTYSTLGRIKVQDASDNTIWDVNDVAFWLNIKKTSGKIIQDENKIKGNTQK